MSDQATFEKHLEELDTVFGKLSGDFQTGPKNKITEWFDELLDNLYGYEDSIERTINTRLGYDEDSFDDEDVVEREPEADEEETVLFNEDYDDIEEEDTGNGEDEETVADNPEDEETDEETDDEEEESEDEDADDYRNVNISIRLK
jgi:hypothetical protein